MRHQMLFRLLGPVGAALARQLSEPHGWFGRAVMTRALNRGNRELIEATLDGLTLAPASRLLDVGFCGGLLLELARRRGVRLLAGVDPSEAAIRSLRERPPRWLAGAELRLEQGRAESMPFADEAFDAVASTNTVYFWPDPAVALAELKRVLRAGGQLALGFSGSAKLRSFQTITRHGFRLHENGDLLACAARAGFSGVQLVELHGRSTEGDFLLLASG
jgi:SAM-dependent methyltransferase